MFLWMVPASATKSNIHSCCPYPVGHRFLIPFMSSSVPSRPTSTARVLPSTWTYTFLDEFITNFLCFRHGRRACVVSQPPMRALRRPQLIKPRKSHIQEAWDHQPAPSCSPLHKKRLASTLVTSRSTNLRLAKPPCFPPCFHRFTPRSTTPSPGTW